MVDLDSIVCNNRDAFLQHLRNHLHIPRSRSREDILSLLQESARHNAENSPIKTNFLRPLEDNEYESIEISEIFSLIKETIMHDREDQLRDMDMARRRATYTFDRCVGVLFTLDESGGYHCEEIRRLK